eukprot:10002000-Alexandrium_andersonii.AAC.1
MLEAIPQLRWPCWPVAAVGKKEKAHVHSGGGSGRHEGERATAEPEPASPTAEGRSRPSEVKDEESPVLKLRGRSEGGRPSSAGERSPQHASGVSAGPTSGQSGRP